MMMQTSGRLCVAARQRNHPGATRQEVKKETLEHLLRGEAIRQPFLRRRIEEALRRQAQIAACRRRNWRSLGRRRRRRGSGRRRHRRCRLMDKGAQPQCAEGQKHRLPCRTDTRRTRLRFRCPVSPRLDGRIELLRAPLAQRVARPAGLTGIPVLEARPRPATKGYTQDKLYKMQECVHCW